MGQVSAMFHFWDDWSHDICYLSVSEVIDKVRNAVYPCPATVVCLCGALCAPTIHHFLKSAFLPSGTTGRNGSRKGTSFARMFRSIARTLSEMQ
jgi:hypothetical protein